MPRCGIRPLQRAKRKPGGARPDRPLAPLERGADGAAQRAIHYLCHRPIGPRRLWFRMIVEPILAFPRHLLSKPGLAALVR